MWGGRLTLVLLFSRAFSIFCTELQSSCTSEVPQELGQASSLLQVSSHKAASSASSWLRLSRLKYSASGAWESKQPVMTAQKGEARAILPPDLFDLGVQVLQNEETLDAVVANTNFHNVTYAGENLYMRLVNGEGLAPDGSCCTFGTPLESDVYGLGSLGALTPNEHGMLDMMDVGGNVGVVSNAAFKKESTRLRIIAVEPIPSTYFLLVWNLWLNSVPRLSLQQWQENPAQPGVLAFNKGVSSTDNQMLGLCYTPPFSMNAAICDCAAQAGVVSHQAGIAQCANVASSSFGALLGLFANGQSYLAFLKMDCEGCEKDLLPALSQVSLNPAWKLGRLGGELHAVSNAVEDLACKFDGGWIEHICNTGTTSANFIAANVSERCHSGATRKACTWP